VNLSYLGRRLGREADLLVDLSVRTCC